MNKDLTLFTDNQKDTPTMENVQGSGTHTPQMIEDKQKSSFYFHKSYFQAISAVDVNQQLDLFWCFLDYCFNDTDNSDSLPVEVKGVFELLKHAHDNNTFIEELHK